MASPVIRGHERTSARAGRGAVVADHIPEEMLAPILAGAYARGLAEMFDMAGVPVILLAGDGRVLFTSPAAGACLGGSLRLQSQHLVCETPADNRKMERLVARAFGLCEGPSTASLGEGRFTVTALPLAARLAAPGQVVRAVLAIDDGGDALRTAMIERMTGMHAASGLREGSGQ